MNIIERLKKSNKERKCKQIESIAEELYQMKEHEGEMWITFDGELIMPTKFINGDPIQVLRQIRAAYTERKEAEL